MEDERPRSAHYFDVDPAVASKPHTVTLALPDLQVELATDRGVFSYRTVDPGTKLLLLEAPPPPREGHVLDLGCGYGAIAVVLGLRAPGTTVWAVDVNRRALALAERNARDAGAHNVVARAPGEIPSDVSFGAVYSNPPVRIGKRDLHHLLDTWLRRLTPDAHAYLVIRKDLGADSLARWLEAGGRTVDRIASRAGYRVLAVGGDPG